MPKKRDTTSARPADMENLVMEQIRSGNVTMRPRWYFWLGSVLSVLGLIAAGFVALLSFNILIFSLRQHGPMGQWRLEQLVASFPWWVVPLAVISLAVGVWLLRRYDFAYRRNFVAILTVMLASLVFSAWLINASGWFDQFVQQGPMRRMMRYEQLHDGVSQPGMGSRGRQLRQQQIKLQQNP